MTSAPTAAPIPGRDFPGIAAHRLPTNSTAGRHPVHRWFNFIAGFSPEFVRGSIQQAGLAAGDHLLDPFAGLGTALLEANWQGLHASGFEPHPFMFDMASAKLTTRSPDAAECVAEILHSLRPVRDLEKVWPVAALKYLHKVVDRANLELLAGARLAESECDAAAQPLYRLVVSRILEMAAGAATDGIYKAPTTVKRSVDVADGSITVLRQIREDLSSVPIGAGSSRLIPGSAEDMSALDDDSHGIAVTSPPYLNNFDFAEMTRMELYFWGYADSWSEITERVRSRLVINTTTAPTKLRRDQERWGNMLSQQLRDVVDPLRLALTEQRLTRAGKKEYDSLVYPYFAQMQSVTSETHRVLKPGASFHTIVSDAALYGVHIHTEVLLAQIMVEQGFEIKEIQRLRNRGSRWILTKRQGAPAASPLGEFHIHAVKRV